VDRFAASLPTASTGSRRKASTLIQSNPSGGCTDGTPVTGVPTTILASLNQLLPDLEELYKDLQAHPELSMMETRTAGLIADRLRDADYEITRGVGKTGVVGRLRNGDGPTVTLRADMDAFRPFRAGDPSDS
jgi:hypothetical protein